MRYTLCSTSAYTYWYYLSYFFGAGLLCCEDNQFPLKQR